MNRHSDLLSVLVLAAAAVLASAPPARAQTDPDPWSDPVNVSRSGAAEHPVAVGAADGTLQVFWWDRFDGVTTAYRGEAGWSEPGAAPIVVTEVVGEGERAELVSTPIAAMPTIYGGAGYAHALWLGAADEEMGLQPLLHSRLALGSASWSAPAEVAEAALDWRMAAAPDGTLHLIYLRPVHSDAFPAGVYVKRSTNGGASWSAPQALYESIYFRLLEVEEAHLWIAADEAGVYAAWDDERLGRTFLAASADGGASWSAPQALAPDEGARRALVLPTTGQPLVLWQAGGAAAGCALTQQRVTEPLTATLPAGGGLAVGEPERVLDELRSCPDRPALHRTPAGDPVLVTGGGGGSLTAVVWDGEAWSRPRSLSFSFEHPELDRGVYLDGLRSAAPGGRLALVGVGQDGDVWLVEGEMDALAWAFAPPSPWAGPVVAPEGEASLAVPALAVDGDGAVHVVWRGRLGTGRSGLYYARVVEAEGGPQLSRPVEVIEMVAGTVGDGAPPPALVVAGGELVAVWTEGREGTITASRARVGDARFPDGWSEPETLPMGGATGSGPAALVDAHGVVYVVYAAPLNEGRGIYLVRSDGEEWSEPRVVFDAEGAGWSMVDHPALAIDPAGTLHAAWVRGSSEGPFPPQGIYYARSSDGGRTWTEPRTTAEGATEWPRLAAPLAGQVHLVWWEGESQMHRWSGDYGQTWTYRAQVGGTRGATAPGGVAADGAGRLYLVAAVAEGSEGQTGAEGGSVYTRWDREQQRWGEPERVELAWDQLALPGASAALDAADGQLHVAFRVRVERADGEGPTQHVAYARRSVPDAAGEPEAAYQAEPTPTPTPGPSPTPTATPRPTVPGQAPEAGVGMVEFGPLSLPVTALIGLALAAAIVAGVVLVRAARRRRI